MFSTQISQLQGQFYNMTFLKTWPTIITNDFINNSVTDKRPFEHKHSIIYAVDTKVFSFCLI